MRDWTQAKGLRWDQQLAGERIEQLLGDEGWTWDQLNKRANFSCNGKRTGRADKALAKYREFIERALAIDGEQGIGPDELYEHYRASVRAQLQIAA
jgi:hypothetical protein